MENELLAVSHLHWLEAIILQLCGILCDLLLKTMSGQNESFCTFKSPNIGLEKCLNIIFNVLWLLHWSSIIALQFL